MVTSDDKIEVENVNTPGRVTRVDRAKYEAMNAAIKSALPQSAPGLTQSESIQAAKKHLPNDLFPGGDKAGWWFKCVQLDMEAKGSLVRAKTKPLRWHLPKG